MADIAAKDVAALRKITGAGMMDCKKALVETDGDIERAKDWLREKGIAGAAKRAGREADQGAIEVLVDGNVGALVELNCETDFVAKGDVFKQAVARVGQARGRARRARHRHPADQRRDGRRLREGSVGHARREDRARPDRPVRDHRRPARRLQAHPERARRGRRARGARRGRPGRTPRRARSPTTSRCTSPARRPAGSPATKCRPTSSSASARSTRAWPARRASPSRPGPRSSRASSTGSTRRTRVARWSSSRS